MENYKDYNIIFEKFKGLNVKLPSSRDFLDFRNYFSVEKGME
jgi:hypothetical protein